MAEIIKMPRLSDTMTEGVVAKWHKKIGDSVKEGELLAEIETDKATMEFESFGSGTLLHIGIPEGKRAPVDAILAILGKKDEDVSGLLKQESPVVENTAENNTTTKPSEESIDVSAIQATLIRMPRLSDTMTEGVVAKWHKKTGDKVNAGELLAEIETDKATMEFEAFESGTLLYMGVKEGEKAPVDAVLAIIGEKNADYKKLLSSAANQPAPQVTISTGNTQKQSANRQTNQAPTDTKPATASTQAKASPLAKKLAAAKGIALTHIKGSGDGGRIVKRDIDNYAGPSAHSMATFSESYSDEDATQMRKTIARRLAESKFSAPHFYLTIEIDMERAIDARNSINKNNPVKISFNDFVIKASAAALRQHPAVNSSWMGDFIRRYNHIHIGVAVAVEDGLLVPVIRFADGKTLSQIGTEVKQFADKARTKQLQPADWEGNTFTISNLGMFGIDEFTAIINPPDACILAVGGIQEKPVIKNGQIVPGHVMKVTLSCDHRVVDGASGAAFLATFKNLLENPVILLGAGAI